METGQVPGGGAFQQEGRAPAGNLKRGCSECVRRQWSPEDPLCSPWDVPPTLPVPCVGGCWGSTGGLTPPLRWAPLQAQFCLRTMTCVCLRIWGTAPKAALAGLLGSKECAGGHKVRGRPALGGAADRPAIGVEGQKGRPVPGRLPTPGRATGSALGSGGPAKVSERCSHKVRGWDCRMSGLWLTLGGREGWQGSHPEKGAAQTKWGV